MDENDVEIGQAEKLEAHQKALLHRAFSVMLYRKVAGKVEFLLQRRAEAKYHCGGLWTNTCCSHPRPGESTQDAAERRLQEELGVRLPLTEIGHFTYTAPFDNGLTEHEFDHVFVAEYALLPEHFNQDEISVLEWVSLKDLGAALMSDPDHFTPWLPQVLVCCLEYFRL